MAKQILKNPLFIIGFLFVFSLFAGSIYYQIAEDNYLPQTDLKYSEDGTLEGKSPFSPVEVPPLGTDKHGYHMWEQILIGAKYTIGLAVVIAFLRVVFSVLAGIITGTYFRKATKYLTGIVDSMHYVPIALLVYYLLSSVIMSDGMTGTYQYTFLERVGFQVIIMALVAIPTTTLLVSNETNSIWNREFIESARTLGGSRFHILRKHVMPHLWPRLILVFVQQIVSVLILLLHLGLLKLFFGGTNVSFDLLGTEYMSSTYEWSGLIGFTYQYLAYQTWIPLVPILFFTVTVLAFNLMLEGIKVSLERSEAVAVKKKKKGEQKKPKTLSNYASEKDFQFLSYQERAESEDMRQTVSSR
ncbi:ABC transporter permease [Pseudalkalibacillus caeni]|nr:ABC transporter permease subunit [Pseudalkalibacillus caeni]